MRSLLSQRIGHVAASIVVLGTSATLVGVTLVGAAGVPLGASVACGCEGAGGGYITVEPKPVKFAGGKSTVKVTVRNHSAEALSLEVSVTSGFKLLGGCTHVITGKCEETVECEKTLNTGWFKAATEPPDDLYWDETNLQC
jgi:hypothetical protein